MKKVSINKNLPNSGSGNEQKISLEGYPQFPIKEDIEDKPNRKKHKNTDSENSFGRESKVGTHTDEVFGNDIFGDDLEIPGSELDDQQEEIGSEDEENNYYR